MSDIPEQPFEGDKPVSSAKGSKKKKPATKPTQPSKNELKEINLSKRIAKIKGTIAKQKEDEEQAKRLQEEEERRLEEQRRLEEEKRLKEEELKERRKQKERERKQRLKEEGKLLTAKQRENRRKAMELLENRGFAVPGETNEVKKKPVYTKLKKRPTQYMEQEETPKDDVVASELVEEQSSDEELESWEVLSYALLEKAQVSTPSDEESCEVDGSDKQEGASCAQPTGLVKVSELTEDEKTNLIEQAREKIRERHKACEAERDVSNLRSGVICVLGHVDTGKTKILDKLRNTHVQDREAGGITQQIGATNVPQENILLATRMCSYLDQEKMRLPGLLIIDTPGHESFSNLRIRGSSLCDVAILVVDLMHSLEEQTKESIRLLTSRKTPFIVALNKIDRLYGWDSSPDIMVEETMKKQSKMTLNDFNHRLNQVIQDFALMQLNVELFYKNTKPDEYISMVPTSAHTGDGMGDLLACLCMYMENSQSKRLAYTEELSASVMEVKEINGLGTTIDVIVVNGRLREGDTIVLAGQEGPIVTVVRGILQPAPMSELRVKNNYQHLKSVKGAEGVKLIAKDLEKAMAGLPLYVAKDISEELFFKEEVCRGLSQALKAISVDSTGVHVMASTIGSLESLLVYLKSVNIPYSGINIGTVHKKDVMKASVMIEREPKWAVILAFDVRVDKDAQKLANQLNVRIFTSDIIYRLHAQLEKYITDLQSGNQQKHRDAAVFPCKLSILPDMIFNKRAPIVMGVRVDAGVLRVGTPICVPSREFVNLGRIFSIESNHKPVQEARIGMEVCVRIDPSDGETPKLYGRHFDGTDQLISRISRESIDVMKEYFREDLKNDDWKLMRELKSVLNIL